MRPTEDPEKVRTAILNLFPECEISLVQNEVVGKTASLDRFKTLIRNQKILDSVRKSLLAGVYARFHEHFAEQAGRFRQTGVVVGRQDRTGQHGGHDRVR